MRYYFAAAYGRHAEMSRYAGQLEAAGLGTVVSRWHREVTPGLDQSFDAAFLGTRPDVAWEHGQRDLVDLRDAEVVVSFTDGAHGRGGRQVEFGYALALHESDDPRVWAPRLVIVGPREHVFHCHPDVAVFAEFDHFLIDEILSSRPRESRA